MKAVALMLLAVAATAQSLPPFRYPLAGGEAPVLLSKADPEYTSQAKKAGIEGIVVLHVVIGTDGHAHGMRVVKGLGFGLDAKAIEAVRKWRFQPGTKNGVPVKTPATLEIRFRFADRPKAPTRV